MKSAAAKPRTAKSHAPVQDARARILTTVLPDVAFEGWTWKAVTAATVKAGYAPAMADAVFPAGMDDVLDAFSAHADDEMMARLLDIDVTTLRVRDRIRAAVLARLDALASVREAVRMAAAYWALPYRGLRATRLIWRTADRIWVWAGDTATDYNHYTKRVLLSAVLGSTLLAWLDDDSPGFSNTNAFLDRRIGNVMQLGQALGRIKKRS